LFTRGSFGPPILRFSATHEEVVLKPQQLILLVIALTIGALAVTFAPLVAPGSSFAKKVAPRLGLDIQGGARVVLQAETAKLPQGQTWNEETRQAVLNTIENRVNANGVAEPVIAPKGQDQFVVEIPSINNEREVLEQLQTTAQLQFYYSPEWRTPRNALGRYEIQRDEDAQKRELHRITDNQTKATFRDLFQINQELRAILDKGLQAGDKGREVTLPAPLPDLPAVSGRTTARVEEGDVKRLDELADEMRNFNSFLQAARLELDGSDIKPTAKSGFEPTGRGGAIIDLEFTAEGSSKFARFTRDHTNEVLMIYLDGRILTAPSINEPITNGRAQISGFATLREAKQIADLLNGGALPVPLKVIQFQSVEATLGKDAVRQGLTAGLIGLGAVAAFMIGYYLLPGAVAVAALLLYTLFTYAIFVLIPVTFTLPGIAAFILSVGMAVDANILIFERTKEELRAGKGMRSSIETGFQRAFSAILDSNVCTAVTSILLYYFGTGAVRGFALTLLIGVAISMFTAITVSRTLLLQVFGNRESRDGVNLWGINRQLNPRLSVVKRRAFWYGLSLAIIVPGVIFAAMGGFKPGIDFTGGSELTLKTTQPVTRTQIEEVVTAQGIQHPLATIGENPDSGGRTVFLRIPRQEGKGEITTEQADALVQAIAAKYPGTTREGFESIGSTISAELTWNALTAITLSSIFIVFYLAFRFSIGGLATGVKYGVCAIIAMLHDTAVLVALFCVLGYFMNWTVDSLFVTAALTVIGFSVHDTIVIFDRIRENLHRRSKGVPFDELVNDSINETFARSVFTSLTVIITLVSLVVFGGPVIRPLNTALLIGIVSGTFSSIFNAAPLVVDWQRIFRTSTTPERSGGGTGGTTAAPRPATSPASAADRPSPAPRPAAPRPTGVTPSSGPTAPNGAPGSTGGTSEGAPKPQIPGGPRPRRRRM
jgi:SecD/SecF fusion protein